MPLPRIGSKKTVAFVLDRLSLYLLFEPSIMETRRQPTEEAHMVSKGVQPAGGCMSELGKALPRSPAVATWVSCEEDSTAPAEHCRGFRPHWQLVYNLMWHETRSAQLSHTHGNCEVINIWCYKLLSLGKFWTSTIRKSKKDAIIWFLPSHGCLPSPPQR